MDGIAWAGSAMVAAGDRLEIAAQNLANVSTDGFARIAARGRLTPAGVSIARDRDAASQGPLRRTGRDLDFAIVGNGTFVVEDGHGRRTATRAGSFTRERDGSLRDAGGRTLLAGMRALHVPEGAHVDARGCVVSANGSTLERIPLPPGSALQAGFLEEPAVNAVSEMIDILRAQRSFESAQKVIFAIDRTREKSSGDVARLK
ncbi:MAG: flagellar hook-basal body complex protein [Candidatus Eremiobacteraeota bacterium]|nr:flagellar hook-basal body complex protein [Candidatus Eremiobacteraeota bacterium]